MSIQCVFLSQKPSTSKTPQHVYIACMFTHSREFPCMYPGIHQGDPLYVSQDTDTSLTHLQRNRVNVKITKQNAAIGYMQKVTVAEPKAIPVV